MKISQAGNTNLIKEAIVLASSFAGSADRTVKTSSYYENIGDGNTNTFWSPMDKQAPHWIEIHWQYPLTINRFVYYGDGLNQAILSTWIQGEWRQCGMLSASKNILTFSEQTTRRLRLDIINSSTELALSEVEVYGPQQPIPPRQIPDIVQDSSSESITIDNIKILPEKCSPGQKVRISFSVGSFQTLKEDYYYLIDIKDVGALSGWLGDFEVESVIGTTVIRSSKWLAEKKYPVNVEFYLPAHTPAGTTDIKITAISVNGDKTAILSRQTLGVINVLHNNKTQKLPDFPKAKLEFNNGQLGFKIGDTFRLPFFMRYFKTSGFEQFYESKSNGIDLQYFLMYNRCLGAPGRQDYFDRLDMNIRNMLRVRPESYIMVGVDLRTHPVWLKANPKELMIDAFGKYPCDIKNESGMVSLGSKKYEDDCRKFLSDLMEFLATKSYAGRIVGWHPFVATQLDSFIGGISQNRGKGRSQISIGDFHPGAILQYQTWLRKKYHGSVDELREAWNNKQITFTTAEPVINELVKAGAQGGIFRDPLVCPAAYDYLEFLPSLLGSFNRRIASFIKEKTDNKALVMIHYGAILANLRNTQPSGARQHVNNFDLPEMLKDPNIDMYVYAPNYHTRHSGQPYVVWLPVDSLTLHNRIFLADNDERTFSAGTLQHGRHRGVAETRAVMMRDMTWHLLKNTGAWFSDMSYDTPNKWSAGRYPWFARPETTKSMKDVINIFTKNLNKKHISASEIAVFVSTSTPRYEDIYYAPPLYYNLIYKMLFKEINILGTPYDIYMMSDLGHPDIKKDYKLYIFINPFFMTSEEKVAVNKLKSNGKTLLWFYAPGYVDCKRGLITEGITETTGINVAKKKNGHELLRFHISNNVHPICRSVVGREYVASGYGDDIWEKIHPAEVGPVFYVSDSRTTSLGTYPDGKIAFSLRQFSGWNSIYCAVPLLDADILRNIADFAGVHLYTRENVVMAADNRFLMFNNGYEHSRDLTVCLPQTRTVMDALSGVIISEGTNSFKLHMSAPDTKILQLLD